MTGLRAGGEAGGRGGLGSLKTGGGQAREAEEAGACPSAATGKTESRIHHMIACQYRGFGGCDQCHSLPTSFFGPALKFKDPIAAGGEAGGGRGLGR
jgi:hypothetical protein